MQTLDISEVTFDNSVTSNTESVSSSSALPMKYFAVNAGRFQAVLEEFSAACDSDVSVRLATISELANTAIHRAKSMERSDAAKLAIDTVESILIVAAAKHAFDREDVAAEIQLQSEELSRLQDKVSAREAEIGRLVMQAHKPVVIGGKRKISLTVRPDGSISCS